MPASDLRGRYVELLLGRFEETSFPSAPMMDRLEAAITDREAAERYVGALLDAIDESDFPSPQMLDRVNRLLGRLEQAQ